MDPRAIIDLGTNTFHLLIASEDNVIIHEEKNPVRLGAGGINNSIITAEGMARALQCIKNFKSRCDELGVQEIRALGTSALRNATNANEFSRLVKEATGIIIEIISGNDEARFIYQGVRAAVPLGRVKNLIVDIGGGSVEFIMGNESEIFWKQSIEVGGQRLLERFHQHDPISSDELNALDEYLKQSLQPLIVPLLEHKPETLVGSSGTFETLSDIYCVRENIPNHKLPKSPFSIDRFHEIHQDLVRLNKTERIAMPGMIEWRAEMIVCTCRLVNHILHMHKFRSVKVSRYSLKEGVLFS
jgi:exopolyphosphatase / guanosine-5'-triphosphate,3'-diphosphate pyrophosphatase